MRRLFALLPFVPAVVMTAVFLVGTALNAEFITHYATGRLLWVPVSFALYYAVFLAICWLFGWPLKLAMAALLITPGVLVLHLIPGVNQPGDRIGEIAWSNLAEWIVHYPGMEVWSPMHDHVQSNQHAHSIHPDTLLSLLTTAYRVRVGALAWHDDRLWMFVEADHQPFLVLVDGEGSLTTDGHWAQGLHLRNGLTGLYATERGLLVQGTLRVSRLQESGLELVGKWKDLTPIPDGFFVLDAGYGREGDWLFRLDTAGDVQESWPWSELKTQLGVPPEGFVSLGLIGAYGDGVVCWFRAQEDEGLLVFDKKTGWTVLPDQVADTAWKFTDDQLILSRNGDLFTVPLDGSSRKTAKVSDVMSVIGPLADGLLIRSRSGFETVTADLSTSRPWAIPTEKWLAVQGPIRTQQSWTMTPNGPVFAASTMPTTHWGGDAQGTIVPVWRVGLNGTFDATYNTRYVP